MRPTGAVLVGQNRQWAARHRDRQAEGVSRADALEIDPVPGMTRDAARS